MCQKVISIKNFGKLIRGRRKNSCFFKYWYLVEIITKLTIQNKIAIKCNKNKPGAKSNIFYNILIDIKLNDISKISPIFIFIFWMILSEQ